MDRVVTHWGVVRALATMALVLLVDGASWVANPMQLDYVWQAAVQLVSCVLCWSSVLALLEWAVKAWLCRAERWVDFTKLGLSTHSLFALALSPVGFVLGLVSSQSRGLERVMVRLGPLLAMRVVWVVVCSATSIALLYALRRVTLTALARWPLGVSPVLCTVLASAALAAAWADSHLYVGLYAYPHVLLLSLEVLALFWFVSLLRLPAREQPRARSSAPIPALLLLGFGAGLGLFLARSDTVDRHPVVLSTTALARLYRAQVALLGIELPVRAPTRAPSHSSPPAAGPAFCHNAIVVVIDSFSWKHTSLAGYPRPTTPNLQALARSGWLATQAIASASSTLLTVPALLLGAPTAEHEQLLAREPVPALPALLAAQGVDTQCEAALAILTEYGAEPKKLGCGTAIESRINSSERSGLEATLSERRPSEGRFFAYVHLMEAHAPYKHHQEFDFGATTNDRYDSSLAFVDAHLGRIVEALKSNGYWDSTCLIVTGDHGEALGEHGGYQWHTSTMYEEQIHVPLVVVGPGIHPGTSACPVDSTSIAPTVLRLMGMRRAPTMAGRDLLEPSVSACPLARSFAPNQEMAAVLDGRFKLIGDRKTATLVLFDLLSDPQELRPINRMRPEVLSRLLGELEIE